MAKIASKPKSQLDRIREVSPHYADLLQKNRHLHDRYEELIGEIKPLAEQSRRVQVGWVSQMPKPKPQPVVRHRGALALVGDLISPQPEEEINPPPPRPSWHGEQRLRELGEEAEAVSEAIKLLVPELARARREYSRKVAASRRAEYADRVERVVNAARALGDSLIEHHEFIYAQNLDGVDLKYLAPLSVSAFGNVDEKFSPLLALIHDAVQKRHVSAGQIPAWRMPIDLAYLQGGE